MHDHTYVKDIDNLNTQLFQLPMVKYGSSTTLQHKSIALAGWSFAVDIVEAVRMHKILTLIPHHYNKVKIHHM